MYGIHEQKRHTRKKIKKAIWRFTGQQTSSRVKKAISKSKNYAWNEMGTAKIDEMPK